MCANKFIDVLGPNKITNLTASIHTIQVRARCCVREANAPVCCPTSRSKKAVLMRGPSNGLNSSCVITESYHRLFWMLIPYQKLIIISTWCKFTVIIWPLQATDLWLVPNKFANKVIFNTDITLKNVSIPAITISEIYIQEKRVAVDPKRMDLNAT